jgi:hypothetical protein
MTHKSKALDLYLKFNELLLWVTASVIAGESQYLTNKQRVFNPQD